MKPPVSTRKGAASVAVARSGDGGAHITMPSKGVAVLFQNGEFKQTLSKETYVALRKAILKHGELVGQ